MNDTDRSALILRCGNENCLGSFPEEFELTPGATTGDFNISRIGVANPFLVLDPRTKRRLGCLPFVMPEYVEAGLTARVSGVVPCRSEWDEDVQWPPREDRT